MPCMKCQSLSFAFVLFVIGPGYFNFRISYQVMAICLLSISKYVLSQYTNYPTQYSHHKVLVFDMPRFDLLWTLF